MRSGVSPKPGSKISSIDDMRCLLCGGKGHGSRGCTAPPEKCKVCRSVHFTGAHNFLVRNFRNDTWKTSKGEDQEAIDAEDEAWNYGTKKTVRKIAYQVELQFDQMDHMMTMINR